MSEPTLWVVHGMDCEQPAFGHEGNAIETALEWNRELQPTGTKAHVVAYVPATALRDAEARLQATRDVVEVLGKQLARCDKEAAAGEKFANSVNRIAQSWSPERRLGKVYNALAKYRAAIRRIQ